MSEQRLRIAYLHQYYQSREQSGGTRPYEFGRRLALRGHDVHVITSDRSRTPQRRSTRVTEEAGMQVHWLPVPYSNDMSYSRRILAFLQFAALAGPRTRRLRPDVILASSTPLTIAVPGLIAAGRKRARFVFEVRDLWPEIPIEMGALRNPVLKHLAHALAEAAYRRADTVIALSPGMAAGVIEHGYPAERVVIVPNASDLDLFTTSEAEVAAFRAERPWLGDRPLLVYTGTFGTANGVDYLVRLAAKVRPLDPRIRFLLIGTGAHREQTRGLARYFGVGDETLFIEEAIPRSRLPVLLGAATIASNVQIPVPGLAHNSANKVFDALAAGRPIAINYRGWQADLLEAHNAGLVLDPLDLTAAARLLIRRITDQAWVEAASRAAADLARERFARDLLFDVFDSAVSGIPADERGARAGHGPL